jgi:hypothetical protein
MKLLSQEKPSLALSDLSGGSCNTTIPPVSSDIALAKMALEHGSPIACLFLLCCFFVLLTRFIKVCKST